MSVGKKGYLHIRESKFNFCHIVLPFLVPIFMLAFILWLGTFRLLFRQTRHCVNIYNSKPNDNFSILRLKEPRVKWEKKSILLYTTQFVNFMNEKYLYNSSTFGSARLSRYSRFKPWYPLFIFKHNNIENMTTNNNKPEHYIS